MDGLLPENEVSRLVPLYQEIAAKDSANFAGLSVLQHADALKKLANTYKPKTLLDYGCGRGDAYRSPHKLHHHLGFARSSLHLDIFSWHSNFICAGNSLRMGCP